MKKGNQLKSNYSVQNSVHQILYESNIDKVYKFSELNMLFVTLFLPICIIKNINEENFIGKKIYRITEEFSFYLNNFSFDGILLYQILENKWEDSIFLVGIYEKFEEEFTKEEILEIQKHLQIKYNIISLNYEKKDNFYDKFCKDFEKILNRKGNLIEIAQNFEENFKFAKQICKFFASEISEKIDKISFFFVIDYRIFYVLIYYCFAFPQISFGIFWNINFPNPQLFMLIPFYKELLSAFLTCDYILFQSYSDSNSFFYIIGSNYGYIFLYFLIFSYIFLYFLIFSYIFLYFLIFSYIFLYFLIFSYIFLYFLIFSYIFLYFLIFSYIFLYFLIFSYIFLYFLIFSYIFLYFLIFSYIFL